MLSVELAGANLFQADFMKMPIPDNTYDAVYTIEASCHAPDPVRNLLCTFRATFHSKSLLWPSLNSSSQVACYTEIKRVLKPGQLFAGYEWCMTDAYRPDNKDHKRIKVNLISHLSFNHDLNLIEQLQPINLA